MHTLKLVPAICLGLPIFLASPLPSQASPQHGGVGTPPSAEHEATGNTGTVIETMTSGGYTYVQVDLGDKKLWAVAPRFDVEAGDRVSVPEGRTMADFQSPTLNRSFDEVLFVSSITVLGAKEADAHAPPHGLSGTPHGASETLDYSGLTKPEGGHTVAELFESRTELSGKAVSVRGKVVKFSPNIMGKNWVHLKDGTGASGTDDLTITTAASAKVGDTVLVRGVVATDKDFGFGYRYELLVEDASITVE
jgi:hypothetical protein